MESFVILWRAPYCLGNITGCLGNSHRIPMDDSVMCNLIPYEKLHLVSRDRHLRLYCPHHLPISLRLFSYLYIYYDILTVLSFHATLPMSFNFGCIPCLNQFHQYHFWRCCYFSSVYSRILYPKPDVYSCVELWLGLEFHWSTYLLFPLQTVCSPLLRSSVVYVLFFIQFNVFNDC